MSGGVKSPRQSKCAEGEGWREAETDFLVVEGAKNRGEVAPA